MLKLKWQQRYVKMMSKQFAFLEFNRLTDLIKDIFKNFI